MLCKIWGFHGADYEECRFLGYKILVRTTQEIYYASPTEPSRLKLCKIWGFHGGDYEECRFLGYKILVRTSQDIYYAFPTEPSRLMLCKIWGFHGGDYEECCFLGYEIPVRTSQETHYVSAIEPSWLMLCKIWGFHGGDYEECRLLGCYAIWLLQVQGVSEEFIGSIIRVERMRELGTTLALTTETRCVTSPKTAFFVTFLYQICNSMKFTRHRFDKLLRNKREANMAY
jgi:hypothetical protein